MTLKSVLTEQEYSSLNEILKAEYKKLENGNYALDVPVREHPDTLALRNAMVAERDEAERLRKSLKAFEGVDPNEVSTLKRERELVQREKDLSAGKFEKALADATAEINQKLAGALKERDKFAGRVRELSINETALRVINESGGNSKLLLPHLLSITELDDKGRTFIKGQDGKPLVARNWQSADDYKSMAEYVTDLKSDTDWAVAFKPVGARGSNAQPTTTTTNNDPLPVGRVAPHGGVIFES